MRMPFRDGATIPLRGLMNSRWCRCRWCRWSSHPSHGETVEWPVQENRRCVHTRTLAQTAKLLEAQHALVVTDVAGVHLDHHIAGCKALLCVSMGRLQEGDQQVRRTELRVYRQPRHFADSAPGASQAAEFRRVEGVGEQTGRGIAAPAGESQPRVRVAATSSPCQAVSVSRLGSSAGGPTASVW